MKYNTLELYKSMYDVVEQVVQDKMIFTIFDSSKTGRFPFVTLVCTDKGVKKGAIYGWRDLERAKEYIKEKLDNYIANLKHKAELKEQRKEEAKVFAESLQVGDILEASWGYEAVWFDFYKVVDKKGQFVYLQEMNKNVTYEGCKYGCCSEGIVSCGDTPKNNEIIKRKISGNYVKINSYTYASLWDGKAREEGNWH